MAPLIITHRGGTHGYTTVDLCQEHSDDAKVVRRHLGVTYHGVDHGLHRGRCAECDALADATWDAQHEGGR